MSGTIINEKILKAIRDYCKNDINLNEFLVNLIIEEACHSGNWWWKEFYKSKIENFSENWSVKDEN